MKKLILAVLVMATFGASAAKLTQEQQARVDKFNEGWTSLSTMQIQRNDSLKRIFIATPLFSIATMLVQSLLNLLICTNCSCVI
jgi:hypothetical protein